MIWRSGKGGFVGGLKYLIKGFFEVSHTVTTETIERITPSFTVLGVIIPSGVNLKAQMNINGVSVFSDINDSLALQSEITSEGSNLKSSIRTNGVSVLSNI